MGLGPIFVGIRAFESHPSHLFTECFSQTFYPTFFATPVQRADPKTQNCFSEARILNNQNTDGQGKIQSRHHNHEKHGKH